MSDDELPNPKKDLARWTSRQRNSRYLPRKNKKIEGIDLTTGSPQGQPFEPAIKEAQRILARRETMHKYSPTRGAFKDPNYSAYFESLGIHKSDGTKLDWKNFVPGNGATHLYASAVQSVLKKDDVLVVPVPTYGFFLEPENLESKRVIPLFLRPEDDYRLTPECLDSELNRINKELAGEQPPKKVTALLHINPHNPTGIVDNKEEVEALAAIVKKHDLRLVIDDMAYMGLEYGHADSEYLPTKFKDRVAYPMAAVEGMFDKTLTITSLSKAYNLVDLRAGLAVGPEEFINDMAENIGRNVEFSSSIPQIAINAVFDPKNKEEKEKYLTGRANNLAGRQYGLRVLINGWDNDKQAAAVWDNSKDEFLAAGSYGFGRVREEDKFEDTEHAKDVNEYREHLKEKIKKFDDMEKAMNANEDLLDEAKPYLLDELEHRIVYQNSLENNGDWKMYQNWFQQEKNQQRMEKSLMETGIPGIKTVNSVESGFFMLLDATELKGKYIGKTQIKDSADFTRELSQHKGVYLIPGTAMGYPGDRILLRLSFPESLSKGSYKGKSIVDGLMRIREFTQMLKDRPGPIPAHPSSDREL